MDYLGIFGQAVRAKRLEKQLSQEELAQLCNLHRTYIGGIERGQRNVSLLALSINMLDRSAHPDVRKRVLIISYMLLPMKLDVLLYPYRLWNLSDFIASKRLIKAQTTLF